MKRVPLFLPLLLAVALALAAADAGAQESVAVQGQVVNGTAGAAVEPGLAVQLHAFSRTAGTFSTIETTTARDGLFRFDGIIPLEEGGYALTADYGGMRYSTLLAPQDLAQPLELRVYEPTQDISVIRIEHQALVLSEVDQKSREVRAAEFLSLTNTSDRSLVPDLNNVGPGRFSFLRFSLPPDATGLDVQSDLIGGEIIPTGSGFAMTAPVTPGNHNISFSFSFPYPGDSITFRQSLLQGADVFQVLVPDRLDHILVPSLEEVQPVQVGQVSYRVWEARSVAPGQRVEVRLTGLPQPSLPVRLAGSVTRGSFWLTGIPIMLGLVLAGLLIYGGIKAPRGAGAPEPEP